MKNRLYFMFFLVFMFSGLIIGGTLAIFEVPRTPVATAVGGLAGAIAGAAIFAFVVFQSESEMAQL